jgi:GNAT superfamily N-acetyltransferase
MRRLMRFVHNADANPEYGVFCAETIVQLATRLRNSAADGGILLQETGHHSLSPEITKNLAAPYPGSKVRRVIDKEKAMQEQTASQFTLRPLGETDLAACHRLSLALKWPHSLEDWQFIYQLGNGFAIERRSDGQPPALVGSALCWRFGNAYATLGMVIVQAAQQGLGLGRQLMEQLLQELGSRNIMLHATPAGQPLYEKLGFAATGKLHQHQGSAMQSPLIPLPAGERIRPLGVNDIARLRALDARATGMDRSQLLAALNDVAEGVAIDRDGEMLGFALVRRFGHGRVIGPVIAPDAVHAKALISHWINTYAGSFIRIDVPDASGLSEWLSEIGLTRVDTVIAMLKGAPAKKDPGLQLYSLINQALG